MYVLILLWKESNYGKFLGPEVVLPIVLGEFLGTPQAWPHYDTYFFSFLGEATTPNKPEDDVMPIIVGSVLSAIIVVVIAWYIVIRIRNKKKMKN